MQFKNGGVAEENKEQDPGEKRKSSKSSKDDEEVGLGEETTKESEKKQDAEDRKSEKKDADSDEDDPLTCQFCQRSYRSEKVVLQHYKKIHEKKVLKLEKKLHKKAQSKFRPSKKNKLTLNQFKALFCEKNDKYKLLLPKYKKHLKEVQRQ